MCDVIVMRMACQDKMLNFTDLSGKNAPEY